MTEDTIHVIDLARGGAGIGKDSNGRVIFIPYTAPGDQVRVKITREQKSYAQAELIEILVPSPLRVQARCPIFTRCGGCDWQHLPYELQWKTKSNGVRQALKRALPHGANAPWEEFPAQNPWNYRNRIQLHGREGQLGFYAPKSHELVPIDHCDIARPEINAAWKGIQKDKKNLLPSSKIELELQADGSVKDYWNSRHGAGGFRQINDEQNAHLQSWILKHARAALSHPPSPGPETPDLPDLIDLFGGSGNLSIPLAMASMLNQIDCVDTSVPDGPSAGDQPANIRFHRQKVLPWLLKAASLTQKDLHRRKKITIIDPPREGLKKDFLPIAQAIENLGVDLIFAIGCDPDAWARDLSNWVRRGWTIEQFAVFDFFPQTPHIESAALIKRSIR